MLKGFKDFVNLYSPKYSANEKNDWSINSIINSIKTHTFNVLFQSSNPPGESWEILATKEERELYQSKINEIEKNLKIKPNINKNKQDSFTIIGREKQLLSCFKELENTILNNSSIYILIKGNYGSGKSLFVRCLLKKTFESHALNYDLTKNYKFKFIFNSFQLPNTLFDPLNGFSKILQEIYKILKFVLPSKNIK